MSETIRAFIALELGDAVKKELVNIQDMLRTTGADVKWLKPSSMHLTLKFLGNVSIKKIDTVKDAMDKCAKTHKAFGFSLSDIGCFPGITHPRVVWVGVDKGRAQVEEMAKGIEDSLANIGFPKEARRFSAHLTLGRVRSHKKISGLISKIKATVRDPEAFCTIDKMVLFSSILTTEGARYSTLHHAMLG